MPEFEWPDRISVSTGRLVRSRVLPTGGDLAWLSASRGWVRTKESTTSWELRNVRAIRLVVTPFPWMLVAGGVPVAALLGVWLPGPALLAFSLVVAVAVGSWRQVWAEVVGDVLIGGSLWTGGGGSLCFQARAMWGVSSTTRTRRLADQLAATVLGAAGEAEPIAAADPAS